jgi:transcriptional regulator with XRE-family HTH domain
MTASPKTLGALLRKLREGLGQSQSQVSKEVGVSQALYSTWESGTAVPKLGKLTKLAAVLQSKREVFMPFYKDVLVTRDPDVPLTGLQRGAREFVRDHANEHGRAAHDVWILGGTNLSSMKRIELMEGHWGVMLRDGVTLNFIWVLDDLLNIGTFAAMLTPLATLAKNVWEEKGEKAGRVVHYAVQGCKPAPDALDCYKRLKKATMAAAEEAVRSKASVDAEGYIETMHDLYSVDELSWPPEEKESLREAVKEILREWQPDTGIVAYRPLRHAVPPAANIRLMPLSKEIVTGVASEVEGHGRWFWLSPTLTQRLIQAINRFSEVAKKSNSQAPE